MVRQFLKVRYFADKQKKTGGIASDLRYSSFRRLRG